MTEEAAEFVAFRLIAHQRFPDATHEHHEPPVLLWYKDLRYVATAVDNVERPTMFTLDEVGAVPIALLSLERQQR